MLTYLYLEDGTEIIGESFGALKETYSELVFNTGMTGYQEVLTDPSYCEQTVVMTYPIIGNYGINQYDNESLKIQVKGFIVREYSEYPSHYLSQKNIDEYLRENGIPGIFGVDTRLITKKIRDLGDMRCLITYEKTADAVEKIKKYYMPKDVAKRVSIPEKTVVEGRGPKIGLLDLGCKKGIIDQLKDNGCSVVVYPYETSPEEILREGLDALLISNGPGDPKDNETIIRNIKSMLGQLPIWGICLGNQLLALALGADTYKMKFGHRGSNHPVINIQTNKVMISSQNHGYAVDGHTMSEDMISTYININDNTIEGFDCPKYNVKAVQFHPEEGPGPVDGHQIIENWIKSVKEDAAHAKK
ncbi:MAG: carbamoyl phosphate synthase small subunit [Eubacteriaceae bacterium]|nr:carbamoyl phosphate synthase small subunit [Eubacteriaceae bacterium]